MLRVFLVLPAALVVGQVAAQSPNEEILVLPEFTVIEPVAAVERPSVAFEQPVTALRYLPRLDVQTRNFAEAQADITIRGGIFEGTGARIGAVALFDPQTGHYLTEIPLAPEFLSTPRILTGAANSREGFNATAGTIAWEMAEENPQNLLGIAAGTQEYRKGRALGAVTIGESWEFAAEAVYSEGEGSIEFGDHEFTRFAGRAQADTAFGRSTFLGGYQSKFFGWPNLYTPFGSPETENLQTTLLLIDQAFAIPGDWQATAYWRKHRDDYDFNRFTTPSGQFEHETEVAGIGIAGNPRLFEGESLAVEVAVTGQAYADQIASTDLENGPFTSRAYGKLAVLPAVFLFDGPGIWTFRSGLTYDVNDREEGEGHIGGVAVVSYERQREGFYWRLYAEIADASQVPGYTVIGSSPGSFFGGAPDAGREKSRNWEFGGEVAGPGWHLRAALFYREDKGLIDWVFLNSFTTGSLTTARVARAVDIETIGGELFLRLESSWLRIDVGYTYLDKEEDYGADDVFGSFYGLNYAEHRLTLATVLDLPAGFEIRLDGEGRRQAENPLRRSEDEAVLASAALQWSPVAFPYFEAWLAVDNLFESNFEEVPGVPASDRTVAGGVRWQW